MPPFSAIAPDAPARRSRLSPSPGRSRRAETAAALGVALVVVHVLFAPATLVLAVLALLTDRPARWRPAWLAGPAAAGLLWTAAVGVPAALAGFTAGPGRVAAALAACFGHPGRLGRLAAALAGAAHDVPRQLPVALVAASAEAAAALWLARARAARRSADPDAEVSYRPGLLAAARSRLSTAALAAGHTATWDGCALGVDPGTGRPVGLTWTQAAGGVLTVAADARAAARAAVPVAAAAISRRMTVIVIDLVGDTNLTAALTAAADGAEAPVTALTATGPACYEPFRSHPPDRAATLAAALVDWSDCPPPRRQAAQRYLATALAVLAASAPPRPRSPHPGPTLRAPASAGSPDAVSGWPASASGSTEPVAVLDGLIGLLEPGALSAALGRVPEYRPDRSELARRVSDAVAAQAADPGATAVLRGQLERLRSSPAGRWLRPAPAERVLSIGQAVREREVLLFAAGGRVGRVARAAESGAMVGRLAVADLTAMLGDLRDRRLRADGLAWVHGCEAAEPEALAELLAAGANAGMSVVLSTADPAAAARLADRVRVVVTSGPADQELARRLGDLSAYRNKNHPELGDALRWQDETEFSVIDTGTPPSVLTGGRAVPGPEGGWQ